MNTAIHTITGIGPSRFARYMAGCVRDKENELYQKIEVHKTTQLVKSGINTTDAQIRAHQLVVENRAVDNTYVEKDKQGEEGEGPQFSFTKYGDVHFIGFHGSLNTMYADQQIVLPDQYNPEEHKTVLSAYQSLRNGAKQAAHIVHQYNEQGELDIRDVVLLTYDPQTNTGRMHILNISQEGKNHKTLESARDAMQKRLGGFEGEMKTDTIFLFVREEKPIDPMSFFREKMNLHKIHENPVIPLNDYGEGLSREFPTIQSRKDTIPIIRPVFQADENKDVIPFHLPFFLQRLMGRNEKGTLIKQEKRNKKKQKTENVHRDVHMVIARIEKQKEKVEKERRVIVVAEKTGVGIGGALFLLKKEAEQPPLRLTKKEKHFVLRVVHKHLGKPDSSLNSKLSFDRVKRDLRKAKLFHTLGSKDSIDNAKLVKYRETKRSKDKKIKKLRNKDIKKQRNKETVNIIFSRKEKKHNITSKEKRNKILFKKYERELGLHTMLEKISRKILKKGIYVKGRQERKIIRLKDLVGRSILEFTRVWIMFALSHHSRNWEIFNSGNENPARDCVRSGRKNIHHEQSPWILLSIIWHMTMIREQGKAVILPKKKRKKKKNVRLKMRRHVPKSNSLQVLSRFGVIYAYQTES